MIAPCPGVSTAPDSVPGGPNGGEGVDASPRVINRSDVTDAMISAYQPLIHEQPTSVPEGRAQVWMLVDPAGGVAHAQIARTSGFIRLDQLAVRVARVYRFEPVERNGCSIPMWVQLPMTFEVR